jgi:hypothetical protein
MSYEKSTEHFHIGPRQVRCIDKFDTSNMSTVQSQLRMLGSMMNENVAREIISTQRRAIAAQDSLQAAVTPPSISTPIQFLQKFAPGHVRILTGARKINQLTGITTIGRWEDEEIVQGVLELLGVTQPYGDYTNVPLADWNNTWEKRTIVRFELGMEVKLLEMRRAAAMNLDSGAEKRNSATLQLAIGLNNVGFFGYNNGANQTYGFLNDPGLPAYITVANGASGFPQWSTKTYLEIVADIISFIAAIQLQSQDVIDPLRTNITMAVATASYQYLNQVSQFGNSVMEYINTTYPKLRIESAPQLDGANGGANVAIVYAEEVEDGSTDDRRTWMHMVPTQFMVLGVQQETKGYKEDYSMATAGQMLKRPYAVYAASGI